MWDFPQGTLCQRERAAFIVSEGLGWHLIPPTILRHGVHGLGSLQLFINHDPEHHYLTFEGEPAFRSQLQKFTLFDAIINNADRKSGHILVQETGEENGSKRLWGIDHGICFHTDYKLRTVIWEFMGENIPTNLLADLAAFNKKLQSESSLIRTQLDEMLTPFEIARLEKAVESTHTTGYIPKSWARTALSLAPGLSYGLQNISC